MRIRLRCSSRYNHRLESGIHGSGQAALHGDRSLYLIASGGFNSREYLIESGGDSQEKHS